MTIKPERRTPRKPNICSILGHNLSIRRHNRAPESQMTSEVETSANNGSGMRSAVMAFLHTPCIIQAWVLHDMASRSKPFVTIVTK